MRMTYRAAVPFPSVFRRIGASRLEEPTFLLVVLLPDRLDGAAVGAGVEGNGFKVALDRALSVLELVTELTREVGSRRVMVTSLRYQAQQRWGVLLIHWSIPG